MIELTDVATFVNHVNALPIPLTYSNDVTFDAFSVLIRQKEIIQTYTTFLAYLNTLQTKYNMTTHKLPTAREFLCLYVIRGYASDVLNNPLQEHDTLLIETVNNIFQLMYSYNIGEFIYELMIYQELFNQWKTMDKVVLIQTLTNSIAKLEESKALCLNEPNEPEESKNKTIDSINAIIQKLQTMINKIQ